MNENSEVFMTMHMFVVGHINQQGVISGVTMSIMPLIEFSR